MTGENFVAIPYCLWMPVTQALALTVIASTYHCGFDKLMNNGLESGLHGIGVRHQIYKAMKYAGGDNILF
jgi:hypothetical protein